MELYYLIRHRKSDSGASLGMVRPEKLCLYLGKILRAYAASVIGNVYLYPVVGSDRCLYCDKTALFGIFERIVYDIYKYLSESVPVAEHYRQVGRLCINKFNALLTGFLFVYEKSFTQFRKYVDVLLLHAELVVLHPRKVQQILDHLRKPFGL